MSTPQRRVREKKIETPTITIRFIGNQDFTTWVNIDLTVTKATTIMELKQKAVKERFPELKNNVLTDKEFNDLMKDSLRMSDTGKTLSDDTTLEKNWLQDGDTVHLALGEEFKLALERLEITTSLPQEKPKTVQNKFFTEHEALRNGTQVGDNESVNNNNIDDADNNCDKSNSCNIL